MSLTRKLNTEHTELASLRVNRETIVRRSPTPVAAEVGDEVVLMHLPRGRCYGLGLIGTDLWKRLAQPIQVGQLISSLSQEYEADPEVLASDVLETLAEYAAEGLIEVESAS
jgi:hypothetical protein